MKQKNWFWCGAVLFVLTMFIFLQSIQEPLYSGIAGGLSALAATIFFGCGLRSDAQDKSAAESKLIEERQRKIEAKHQEYADDVERIKSMLDALKKEIQSTRESAENGRKVQRDSLTALLDNLRKQVSEQQKFYDDVLNRIQTSISEISEEIRAFRKETASESQSYSKEFAQLSKDAREYFKSDLTQIQQMHEKIESICNLNNEHDKKSGSYYDFMIDQPWAEIKTLSEALSEKMDIIQASIDSILSDNGNQIKQIKKVNDSLNKFGEDSTSMKTALQNVCETLEKQSKENIDAMDHIMQGYSNVTAQDIEVLKALVKGVKV